MDIRWFGTATVIISEDEHSILFDPFISMNEEINAFSQEKAAECSDILITHGHFDHLIDVPALVKRYGQTVHCSVTATETLMKNGLDPALINTVKPGDRMEAGPFSIRVLEGKHIKFDLKLIRRTLINPRIIKYRHNLRKIAKENRNYPEGEVLVFDIEVKGKRLLALGSLNLAKKENYPQGADILMIPFQGRSDIDRYALKFVKRLQPKALYMHHFDDTFPPVSGAIDLEVFRKRMQKKFPGIRVIVPEYGEPVKI